MVICRLNLGFRYKLTKHNHSKSVKYNTTSLVSSSVLKDQYQSKLTEAVDGLTDNGNTVENFNNLFDCVKKVAVETVGLKPKSQRTDFTSDCEVVRTAEPTKSAQY